MPTDVTIALQNVHCIRESEGGSEPYIWPVLLWIDDTTLMTTELVGVRGPALGDARVVLKSGMSAGEDAQIPFPLGALGVRFEDSVKLGYLLLVVALLEHDETPEAAMWAGCKAFSSELRAALADNLFELKRIVDEGNDAELELLIAAIKARVKQHVVSATRDALTGWQMTRIFLGTLNLDDFVGAAYYFSKPVRTTFSLTVKTEDSTDEYRVDGIMDVRTVAETIDLCQAEVDRVNVTQGAVDGIEGQLNALKAELPDAAPAQKASIVAQIARLNEDLFVAMSALEEARQALKACRDHWIERSKIRGTPGGVITGPK